MFKRKKVEPVVEPVVEEELIVDEKAQELVKLYALLAELKERKIDRISDLENLIAELLKA